MKANIYVSATYKDLCAYREAVRDVIRMLDHVDIAMEYYVAEPRRPLVRCLDDVRRCDLYIGLFARCYGYIPSRSNKSITEQEFRTALKCDKDVLCFLLKDDVKWPKEFVDKGEAAEKLQALRNEILERYLVDFFSTPDELAKKVSAAISRALNRKTTPMDVKRELRLMEEWRQGKTIADRERARLALINMGSPHYAAAVKDLLLETKDFYNRSVRHREGVATALYMSDLLTLCVNSRQAMPILIDLLHANDVMTRRFAVFHIGELGLKGMEIQPEIIQEIIKLKDDTSEHVRGELAHTLGKIIDFEIALPAIRMCLKKLAQDRSQMVSMLAKTSLSRVPSKICKNA